MKVIIDTDIGDDIDDAFALALALKSPELEVEAVTTVYGDVYKRGLLASRLVNALGKDDIPVALGCSKPLLNPAPSREPIYFRALEKTCFKTSISRLHAVTLMEKLIDEGASTIITLGPLTNVALLLLKRPDLASKLRLVMMGGAWSLKTAEYNFKCDPEAVHLVLESRAEKTIVGLDVTLKCLMSDEMLEELRRGSCEYHRVLTRYLEEWIKVSRHNPILHDPLAVAAVFKPDLIEWEFMDLKIELQGTYTRGYLVKMGVEEPNARVAVNVDEKAFLKLFSERVLEDL